MSIFQKCIHNHISLRRQSQEVRRRWIGPGLNNLKSCIFTVKLAHGVLLAPQLQRERIRQTDHGVADGVALPHVLFEHGSARQS